MLVLIVSDEFKEYRANNKLPTSGIFIDKDLSADVFSWRDDFRLSDYQIVILDAKVPSNDHRYSGKFFDKEEDVYKLLEAGGVVICLVYYVVNTPFQYKDIIGNIRNETNYHWLKETDRNGLELYAKGDKAGKNIEVVHYNRLIQEYFEYVKYYYKTLGSIKPLSKNGITIGYRYIPPSYELESWRSLFAQTEKVSFPAEIVAVNRATEEPIACVINYNRGQLIFLPRPSGLDNLLATKLCEVGKRYYEKNLERVVLPEYPPTWLDKCKVRKHIELDQHINALIKERQKYERAMTLLWAYGKPLEKTVMEVFKDLGCEVRELEPGATIDLKIIDPQLGLKFAFEVTGIEGEFRKDNRKLAQLLQYIPHREIDERIVVMANTHRRTDPRERPRTNFTKEVVEIAEGNKICLITGLDIFNLWQDFVEGKKSREKIVKSIYDTIGEYTYQATP